MIYPEDERIMVSHSVHSLAPMRDVSTPGYDFPSENLLAYQKPFLAAGMRGLSGCGFCGGLGDSSSLNMGDWLLIGLAAAFVIPHFVKM